MTSPLLATIARQALVGVTPISAPAAHDVFKITGPRGSLFSPRCKIAECNGRESITQEQQAPGYVGAILVIRGEHLVSVTYEFPMWTPGTFAQMDALAAVLDAAQSARPQQTLMLTDLRLRRMRGGGSFRVTPIVQGHQQLVGAGSWSYRVKFMQDARLKLGGGPVQAPRTEAEKRIKDKMVTRDKANTDYEAARVAAVKNAGKL